MTVTVTHTDAGLVLGTPPEPPERTAVLEAAGAVLVWDCAGHDLPAAIVWDPGRAIDWAWQIYGPEVTRALTGEADSFAPVAGPAAAPARSAARAEWARAWWPASVRAAIPPLDPRLIALERACALADIEHLLDDDTAVTASLADGLHAATQLRNAANIAPELRSPVEELTEYLETTADDRGVHPPETAPAPTRTDYALAAGSPGAGHTTAAAAASNALASGAAPLDLSAFAPGAVDAAAEGRWQVVRAGTDTVLEVSVDRAPAHPAEDRIPAPLDAHFAEIGLRLEPEAARFAGRAAVTTAILLTRPEKRTLEIASPGYSGGGYIDAAALIDTARTVLDQARDSTAPESVYLLAERAAARYP